MSLAAITLCQSFVTGSAAGSTVASSKLNLNSSEAAVRGTTPYEGNIEFVMIAHQRLASQKDASLQPPSSRQPQTRLTGRLSKRGSASGSSSSGKVSYDPKDHLELWQKNYASARGKLRAMQADPELTNRLHGANEKFVADLGKNCPEARRVLRNFATYRKELAGMQKMNTPPGDPRIRKEKAPAHQNNHAVSDEDEVTSKRRITPSPPSSPRSLGDHGSWSAKAPNGKDKEPAHRAGSSKRARESSTSSGGSSNSHFKKHHR